MTQMTLNEAHEVLNKMPLSKLSDEELAAISISLKAARVGEYLFNKQVREVGLEAAVKDTEAFLDSRKMPHDVINAYETESEQNYELT